MTWTFVSVSVLVIPASSPFSVIPGRWLTNRIMECHVPMTSATLEASRYPWDEVQALLTGPHLALCDLDLPSSPVCLLCLLLPHTCCSSALSPTFGPLPILLSSSQTLFQPLDLVHSIILCPLFILMASLCMEIPLLSPINMPPTGFYSICPNCICRDLILNESHF